MVFGWRADDGPLLVVFGSSLPSSTKQTTNNVRVGAPLTKRSGSPHEMFLFNMQFDQPNEARSIELGLSLYLRPFLMSIS